MGPETLQSTGSGPIEARAEFPVATREVDGHTGATRKSRRSGPSPDALNRCTGSGRPEMQRTATEAVVAKCRHCFDGIPFEPQVHDAPTGADLPGVFEEVHQEVGERLGVGTATGRLEVDELVDAVEQTWERTGRQQDCRSRDEH